MKLLVLCCFLGAGLAAPPTADSDAKPYHTIVVGLGSAGVTAAATLAKHGKRVLALDAQGRVGGRVNTEPFGDGIVDLGAEWIHGAERSFVYEAAVEHNVTLKTQSEETLYYRSDGGQINATLLNELLDVYSEITDNPTNLTVSIGALTIDKLTKYITENKPELLKDPDFITELFALLNLLTNNHEGSKDWKDVTTDSHCATLGGHQYWSWHRNGYKTFFDIMLNKYNGGPGLPNLDIKLDSIVTLITPPEHPENPVTVKCKDGSEYRAEHVIVTVSLGVLKEKHTSLFSKPLPKDKVTAIEKISMGVVNKIVLSFEKPWWPENLTFAAFLWRGEDKKAVGEDSLWTTHIFGVSRSMGSSNTLTLWPGPYVALQAEESSNDADIQKQSVELLQKFMGATLNITIPQPTGMKRTFWYSNPFTRGSYSYDNIETPQYPHARAWLAAPLTDSAGKPRVLFAGEATNQVHFSTVHGASESGYREAVRLLLGHAVADGVKVELNNGTSKERLTIRLG